jgi:hypothetical protein
MSERDTIQTKEILARYSSKQNRLNFEVFGSSKRNINGLHGVMDTDISVWLSPF